MDNVIYCSKCGAQNTSGASFCQRCGASLGPVISPVAAAGAAASPYPGAVPAASSAYGGFWIRFVAFVIDGIIISVVLWPAMATLVGVWGWGTFHGGLENGNTWGYMAVFPALRAVTAGAGWLYEALLLSSPWQATVGKKLLGLKVTDESGNRISFARATGRHFAKYISFLTLCIGFIMAAFTERKRALHDIIAGTLVMKERI